MPLHWMKNLRRLAYTALFAAISNGLSAQEVSQFSPAPEDGATLQTALKDAEQRYQQTLSSIQGNYKKEYTEIYKQRWENVKETFEKKEVYTNTKAQQYLQSIVDEIVKSNPQLAGKKFSCYFSRSGVPNASYIGEGVILFNMGLFHRMTDESQVAFTICHEISHFLLQHIENSITNYVTTVNSEDFKKQVKAIGKSEFKQGAQVEKLAKTLSFKNRRHSRDHESQADSMAVELMKNTRFSLTGAISALDLLDKVDTDTLNTKECLPRIFHSPDYPFQPKWLKKEEGLLGGFASLKADTALADSLKTHPDCQSRINYLKPVIEKINQQNATGYIVGKEQFSLWQEIFRYEIIDYTYTAKNYTRSLYYTLELLQQRPADPYLVSHAGKLLNDMYAAQKAHKLTTLIDFPSPRFPRNYNLLLQFFQNLYADQVASINYHFLKQYQLQLKDVPAYKTEFSRSIQTAKQ